MELLILLIFPLGAVALVVAALAYWAGGAEELPAVERTEAPAKSAPAFFGDVIAPAQTARMQAPVEVLLLQIEKHVRLEQAAAESFLEFPTSALLHRRTVSPLVN